MAKSSPLLDYLVDHLAPLGDARGRAMFGGFGVYLDGFIIGIIAFDTFFLKTDETNRPAFEAAGAQPFAYQRGGEPAVSTTYWECPADVLEEPERLRSWATTSLAVSRRAKKPAKRSAKKPTPKAARTPSPKTSRKKKR
jgi:DNA transformation protein and related proteins